MNFITQSALHAAIIMDGNGRWAESRFLPRALGHQAGAEALRRVVEAAPEAGLATLTVYAFSSDNWKRPPQEVTALMRLLGCYLESETPNCVRDGVRLSVIGRRDRLDPALLRAVFEAERQTSAGTRLHLRLAVDYSAREAIRRAAMLTGGDELRFEPALTDCAPVDLLIRTGGEQRLSDFLLWESAYAELFFTPVLWPDFTPACLRKIVQQFQLRHRKFGALPPPLPVPRQQRWLR